MLVRPISSHARLMLVIAALFAFVTVGFNTASYADGPRRHTTSHIISASAAVTTAQKSVAAQGNRIHVPRHLAHQPQILPASSAVFATIVPVQSSWPSSSNAALASPPLGGLLRPPQSRTE